MSEPGLQGRYVRFATDQPAHFQVVFQPDLYRTDAPGLLAAKARATAELRAGVADLPAAGRGEDTRPTGVAAWSLAHGPATLLLSGNLSGPVGVVTRPAGAPPLVPHANSSPASSSSGSSPLWSRS